MTGRCEICRAAGVAVAPDVLEHGIVTVRALRCVDDRACAARLARPRERAA